MSSSKKPRHVIGEAFFAKKIDVAINIHKKGKFLEAEKLYLELLNYSNEPDLNHLLGVIYIQKKEYGKSIKYIKKAIINKVNDKYLLNLGNAYRLNGDINNAIKNYEEAIKYNIKSYESNYNLGVIYIKSNADIAIEYFKNAIEIKKDYFEAYNNLGVIYKNKNELNIALNYFTKSLQINNQNCDALINIGNIFAAKNDFKRAEACYNKVKELEKNDYRAYFNHALMLNKEEKHIESLEQTKIALSFDPNLNKMNSNMGSNLNALKKYAEADFYYSKVINIEEGEENIIGEKFINKLSMSDYESYEYYRKLIKILIDKNKIPISLFSLLAIDDDENTQKKLAINVCNKIIEENNLKTRNYIKISKKNKYKIGYFSSDIRAHPVAFLMEDVFKKHDRNKFEIILINNSQKKDDIYKKFIKYFDLEVNIYSDYHALAMEKIKNIFLDVAIDLNGHTKGARTSLFLAGVAPIQINYSGYAGTMGSERYDYILSDINAIPQESHKNFIEKVINLEFFMANPLNRKYHKIILKKEDLGLKNDDFIYACLNNTDKISPTILNAWCQILKVNSYSFLILISSNNDSEENLLKIFKYHGLESRIKFIPKKNYDEYMSIYQIINLFLDTEFLNAGTTATDALSAETLILTKKGNSYSSRYCYAILKELDMDELITYSIEEYISAAIKIGLNHEYYEKLKSKLKNSINKSRVFDSDLFIEDYENKILQIINSKVND